jgi:hypothetical protein
MSEWNGFDSLDLSGVAEGSSRVSLEPGEHEVTCTEAKIEPVANNPKHKKVVADFKSKSGAGEIRMNFNVYHSNAQAMEIGQRQLKSFLTAGNHPNPDKPGDIGSLKGLSCKVVVGLGKPWIGTDGRERQNSEIKVFMPLPDAVSKPSPELDDEIPF